MARSYTVSREDDERVLRIIALHCAGWRHVDIGRQFGVGRAAIGNMITRVQSDDVDFAGFWGDTPKDVMKGYRK